MVNDLQMKQSEPKSETEKIRDFQRKLYLKAKQEKEFRFYVLYDKIRELRFLREAYKRVKANAGSPGVDGVTFEPIEKDGVETLLANIKEELEKRTYRSGPVLRVYIEKANGKLRPLGIPTIKDRIVQNLEETCLLTRRWPAWRWRELSTGFCVERGNLRLRC